MNEAVFIILILIAVGGLPTWGYWGQQPRHGYGPSGFVGLVLTVWIVMWLLKTVP